LAERQFPPSLAYDPVPAGIRLRVRLAAKASRAGPTSLFEGPAGVALKVSVTAPAIEDKANRALVKLLAKGLGVAKGAVAISSGRKDRNKVVTISGRAADIARRLDDWLAAKGVGR
jgi:uncharacterized protein (TIGR00251 family)